MPKKHLILKIVLPILILTAAAGSLWYFYENKPKAVSHKRPFMGMLVEVMPLNPQNKQIQIRTNGVVHAKERIILTAPTSGFIDEMNPSFVEGGFVKEGEILMVIKPAENSNTFYTELEAPFNGVVQTLDVSLDQYVTPGFKLATLIGTNTALVRVDLPLREIARLPVKKAPNYFYIPAQVQLTYGSERYSWNALVQRNLLELTPKGGMAQLVLEVQDPFRLRRQSDHAPRKTTPEQTISPLVPLFIGAFVEVTIPAKVYKNIFIIPAHSLREENTVYLEKDGTLEIRKVEVAYVDKNNIFISKGLQEKEKLITSPLKGAATGLKIRVASQGVKGQFKGQQRRKNPQLNKAQAGQKRKAHQFDGDPKKSGRPPQSERLQKMKREGKLPKGEG